MHYDDAFHPTSPVNYLTGFRLRVVGLSLVRIRREVSKKFHELPRLTDEKSVASESLDCCHRSPLGLGWTNNRTGREISVKERARLRHDQVGL